MLATYPGRMEIIGTIRERNEDPVDAAMTSEPIRILLVDDHAVLRAGLRSLLEAEVGLEVVGEAATGEDGIAMAERLKPDVVVMDLSMPGIGGLEATRRIAQLGGGTRVLVLTMHGEEEH